MFPSKAYRELCILNQEVLREEWEPFHYDVLYILGNVKLIIPHKGEDERVAYVYACPFDRDPMGVMRGIGLEWHPRKNIVWLPRLDQLIEMLEERGIHDWDIGTDGDEYSCLLPLWDAKFSGPDPATALLKAYLSLDPVGEVVK